jgi:hypothetical protein
MILVDVFLTVLVVSLFLVVAVSTFIHKRREDDEDASTTTSRVGRTSGDETQRAKPEDRVVRASAPARMTSRCVEDSIALAYGPPPADVGSWPQRPLYLNAPTYAGCEVNEPIPFNSELPIEFETSAFVGKCVLRFRGLPPPSTGPQRDDAAERLEAYFGRRKRRFQVVVQGRFKREYRADRLITGHEFFKPVVNLPAKYVVKTVLKLLRAMNPSINFNLFGARPHAYVSLGASAQTLRVDVPGQEPDISTAQTFEEHTDLFGGAFEKKRIAPKKRRKLFASAKSAALYFFRPGPVYTFDFYQHVFDPKDYALIFGVDALRVELARHLSHQPAQIMARALDTGDYLWCFALWHERIFASNDVASRANTVGVVD